MCEPQRSAWLRSPVRGPGPSSGSLISHHHAACHMAEKWVFKCGCREGFLQTKECYESYTD